MNVVVRESSSHSLDDGRNDRRVHLDEQPAPRTEAGRGRCDQSHHERGAVLTGEQRGGRLSRHLCREVGAGGDIGQVRANEIERPRQGIEKVTACEVHAIRETMTDHVA